MAVVVPAIENMLDATISLRLVKQAYCPQTVSEGTNSRWRDARGRQAGCLPQCRQLGRRSRPSGRGSAQESSKQ